LRPTCSAWTVIPKGHPVRPLRGCSQEDPGTVCARPQAPARRGETAGTVCGGLPRDPADRPDSGFHALSLLRVRGFFITLFWPRSVSQQIAPNVPFGLTTYNLQPSLPGMAAISADTLLNSPGRLRIGYCRARHRSRRAPVDLRVFPVPQCRRPSSPGSGPHRG